MSTKSAYVFGVSLIAALGGLLFGYHTSIISGALLFLTKEFDLTTFQQELVVSTVLVGALVGAFSGGVLADRWGRKRALGVTLVLFFIGTWLLTEARGFESLLWGRFVAGLGIGVASMAVPLYIAEVAPMEKRGAFVSLNQLMITIGIVVAFFVAYLLAEAGAWRKMFGIGFIPLAVQAVGLLFLPESPSWLMGRGRMQEAAHILGRLHGNIESGRWNKEEKSKEGLELRHPKIKNAFWIGIGMSIFQQITGINTVIYYAPKIFQAAGSASASADLFSTLLVGIVNVAFTVVSLWLIDRWGRRPLLMMGLIGMAASLSILGSFFVIGSAHLGWIAAVSLMSYVAFFAISLGPVTWLLISEIYPLKIRGRAMGIATFANWTCNYLVSISFLSLIEKMGAGATFWLYALISLFALWFVGKKVPETKGKTLEQIQQFWK
jgi:SP family galactose:H+ symporter-like MFS transporter